LQSRFASGFALASADEHEIRDFEAEMHRLKGELLLRHQVERSRAEHASLRVEFEFAIGDSDSAEAQSCFLRAVEIARRQSAKSLELRATMSLARPLAKQGRRDKARRDAGRNYNWFTEGFDTADLEDAKATARRTKQVVLIVWAHRTSHLR
jgi:hypothetical protein